MLGDPANEKKKKSDYTAMFVIGASSDGNDYVLDIIRDRLSLTERTRALFELHRKWKQPNQKILVGYEKYGKDADIEHIREKMEDENYRFEIIVLGGAMAKNDRIRRIIPDFENGAIWFPKTLHYVNYEGQGQDLVRVFIDEEYDPFPVGEHDDMLDALARKKDMKIQYPITGQRKEPITIPRWKRF